LFGAVLWRLSFAPEMSMNFDVWMYILLGLCVVKALITVVGKNITIVNVALFGVGIYMLIANGFTWPSFVVWILVLLLDVSSGIVAGFVLVANITGLVISGSDIVIENYSDLKWVAISLISLSIILFFKYYIVEGRDRDLARLYLRGGKLWIAVAIFYGALILTGYTMKNALYFPNNIYARLLGISNVKILLSYNLKMIGRTGLCFCAVWIGRELIMMFIERQKEKKAIADMKDTYKY